MVLVSMTLGILLLTYLAMKASDNTNPERSEDQEAEDAAKKRKIWRHRMIDWNF